MGVKFTFAHFSQQHKTTQKRKQWGGLYPADRKGRRLVPCDFVCKATQTPRAGARRRTTARTQGLSLTKGSRRAVSETLVYLFSYSLPNQYQKQQKRRREEDTQKNTRKSKQTPVQWGERIRTRRRRLFLTCHYLL